MVVNMLITATLVPPIFSQICNLILTAIALKLAKYALVY